MDKRRKILPLLAKILGIIAFGGLILLLTFLTDGEIFDGLDFDFDFHRKKKKEKMKLYENLADEFSNKTVDESSSDAIDEEASVMIDE